MKKNTCYFLIPVLLLLTGCSKDDEPNNDISVEITEQEFYFGDEYQIQATSDEPITYTSDDEYHATVSGTGLVTAGFVGETEILLSNGYDTKKVPVKVHPKSSLYPEPNLNFGISRSALIGKLGAPDAETEGAIGYGNHSSAATMIMYSFDENDNMESAVVMVKTSYTSELGTFLAERYLPVDTESFIFVNALEESKITMLVGADLYDEDHWMVIYFPYTSENKNSIQKSRILPAVPENLYRKMKNKQLN